MGNSVALLLRRIEEEGRPDLVEAIERGEANAFEVAVALGIRSRAKRLGAGRGYLNVGKRRHFRLLKLGLDDGAADRFLHPPKSTHRSKLPRRVNLKPSLPLPHRVKAGPEVEKDAREDEFDVKAWIG